MLIVPAAARFVFVLVAPDPVPRRAALVRPAMLAPVVEHAAPSHQLLESRVLADVSEVLPPEDFLDPREALSGERVRGLEETVQITEVVEELEHAPADSLHLAGWSSRANVIKGPKTEAFGHINGLTFARRRLV